MRERRKDAEAIAIVGKCLIFCAINFTMITLLSLLIIPPDKDSLTDTFSYASINRRQQCSGLRP